MNYIRFKYDKSMLISLLEKRFINCWKTLRQKKKFKFRNSHEGFLIIYIKIPAKG
jgi:hypothetical protein